MPTFKQHIPFVITEFEADIWNYPPHNHDHFEIILIKKGVGRHIINNIPFQYQENDLFLISPNDTHYFTIEKRTSFCYLKFTELLFKKDGNIQEKAKWMQRIESILFNPNLAPGDIKYADKDKERIFDIVDMIIEEHHHPRNYSGEIIADAVNIILSIIARNICNLYCDKQIQMEANKKKINELLTYIRYHIYDPELMRMEVIAEHLNMSKNYISIFFKNHIGQSLQKYIQQYRTTLAENRIRLSDFTISEISHQLGFTDESHLIRHFKKKYGVTPGEYRKRFNKKTIHQE